MRTEEVKKRTSTNSNTTRKQYQINFPEKGKARGEVTQLVRNGNRVKKVDQRINALRHNWGRKQQ